MAQDELPAIGYRFNRALRGLLANGDTCRRQHHLRHVDPLVGVTSEPLTYCDATSHGYLPTIPTIPNSSPCGGCHASHYRLGGYHRTHYLCGE